MHTLGYALANLADHIGVTTPDQVAARGNLIRDRFDLNVEPDPDDDTAAARRARKNYRDRLSYARRRDARTADKEHQ